MREDTPPSQVPMPVEPEFKLRRDVVFYDFLKAGLTILEAEELCMLIRATHP